MLDVVPMFVLYTSGMFGEVLTTMIPSVVLGNSVVLGKGVLEVVSLV